MGLCALETRARHRITFGGLDEIKLYPQIREKPRTFGGLLCFSMELAARVGNYAIQAWLVKFAAPATPAMRVKLLILWDDIRLRVPTSVLCFRLDVF